MTAEVQRFGCPECGALLAEDASGGAVRCAFCGVRSAPLETPSGGRQYLAPRLDRSAALLALRRGLLDGGVLPRSLRRELRPVDARLVFVPYYVARGIRAGVVERPEEVRTTTVPETEFGEDGALRMRMKAAAPARVDRARVVLDDVEQSAPAVRRPGWGLEDLSPSVLAAGGATPQPAEVDEVRRRGAILAVELEPTGILARLAAEPLRGSTRLVAPTVRTVLLPVWRIRWRTGSGLYDATVDAVEGRLLAARAPENDRYRVPLALGTLGLAGLVVGWLLRTLVVVPFSSAAASGMLSLEVLLVVGVVALLLLGLFSTFAWNVVRYDAERVYERGQVRAEYLNRPPLTGLDRFWARVFGLLNRPLDPTLRGDDD